MKIQSQVRISRTTSSSKPYDSMHIEIIDEASGLPVADLRLSMEEFARCITGMVLPNISCEIEDGDFRVALGKQREHKVEQVQVHKREFAEVHKKVKHYEKDGWISNLPSEDSYANRAWSTDEQGNITYAVEFVRWV